MLESVLDVQARGIRPSEAVQRLEGQAKGKCDEGTEAIKLTRKLHN